MTGEQRPRILVFEDASGIASGYADILGDEFEVTICTSGKELAKLLDNGFRSDVAIMDAVAPPERDDIPLGCATETGLRLMLRMADEHLCRRFYVITARFELARTFTDACAAKGCRLLFEHKLDHAPEELAENVRQLLA